MRLKLNGLACAVMLVLQGCSMAPTYKTPATPLPPHYSGPWQAAKPADNVPAKWWALYQDPQLDALQGKLIAANPDLAAALAHFDAAQAYASQLHGGLFPQIGASGSSVRQRQSENKPLRGSDQPNVYNTNTSAFTLNWDLDFWGKVRNQVAAGDAQAQASADDLEVARQNLQRQLSNLYLQLAGLDAQQGILKASLDDYTQALQLTRDRYEGKIASELDMTRAQSELAQAQAQLDEVISQRNLTEHAIGELVGEPATTFTLPAIAKAPTLPGIPGELPSTLLQRRPDVAAAERRVFAANANIGVAKAAFYPDFSLSGYFGGQDMGVGNLLAAANRFWAIGPVVNLPIFDGGKLRGAERQAKAEFAEASAHYRGSVLKAVREVEDNLSQLRDLKLEAADQQAAVDAATQTQTLAMNSYQAGAVNYLDVVTAQTAALDAQRRLQDVQTRRLQASVGLMVALGGGWKG
ncbi:efflux transporter outer membrane subunit [Pseudomonas abieticivorans]|uniref:efflux transporter outer membrane subunit n=1 Tax=Pseudomonas abieticivorans TaxID=2931382 RepID=UPI0020C02D5F|nr:efflux transporter outer membrane subunit [Pseudomonas sp. PIA16]